MPREAGARGGEEATSRPLTEAGRQARQELLDAGSRVVDQLPAATFLPAIGPTAEAAGRPPSSLRHQFGDLDGWHRAFLASRITVDDHGGLIEEFVRRIGQAAEAIDAEPIDVATEIARLARWNLEATVADRQAWRRQLLYTAAGMSEDGAWIAEQVREDYELVVGRLVEVYEDFLRAWGRRIRSGFGDVEDVARSMMALAEGLVLQAAADPELEVLDLFERSVVALLMVATVDASSPDPGWDELLQVSLRRGRGAAARPRRGPAAGRASAGEQQPTPVGDEQDR